MAALTDYDAVMHSEVVVRAVDSTILANHCRWAFFDDEKAKVWPKVSVDVTWCEKSAWVMIDAAWWVQTLQDEAKAKGIKGREVKFTMFREANHFVRSFIAIAGNVNADNFIPAPLGHTREGRKLLC